MNFDISDIPQTELEEVIEDMLAGITPGDMLQIPGMLGLLCEYWQDDIMDVWVERVSDWVGRR